MLPERFCERMKSILGAEYENFERSLSENSVRGIRVNTVKISPDTFKKKTDLRLTQLPYLNEGFIPDDADGIGTLPEHHSGMIYVQDPGAMATVAALDVKHGWRVLDACAAPGGKASQLAALIGDEGFLLANEYVPKRAKIIVSNFERLGIRNAVVTSLDTAALADTYKDYFDLVLCDAPCSGEGMFRKYDEALTEWSEENVLACAERQKAILANCAPLVRAGGYLLYSTCTYSKEENEDVIEHFLGTHSSFELVSVRDEVRDVTADGLGNFTEARRFYPHISRGEGQFIALLKNTDSPENLTTKVCKPEQNKPTKQEMAIILDFWRDNMTSPIPNTFTKQGELITIVRDEHPMPKHSVFMSGVMLGEIKKGILFPHHQLFSAYGTEMKKCVNLERGDGRVEKYLRGEEIEVSTDVSGWCAVCYEGVALGGGKASCGRLKNHYPKGLRNK